MKRFTKPQKQTRNFEVYRKEMRRTAGIRIRGAQENHRNKRHRTEQEKHAVSREK
jgi:hypothetical protein